MFGNKLHFFVFISFILYVQKYFFAAKGCISRMTTNKNRFSNLKEFPPYNQIKYNSVQLLYINFVTILVVMKSVFGKLSILFSVVRSQTLGEWQIQNIANY